MVRDFIGRGVDAGPSAKARGFFFLCSRLTCHYEETFGFPFSKIPPSESGG